MSTPKSHLLRCLCACGLLAGGAVLAQAPAAADTAAAPSCPAAPAQVQASAPVTPTAGTTPGTAARTATGTPAGSSPASACGRAAAGPGTGAEETANPVFLRLERALGAGRFGPEQKGATFVRADHGEGEFEERNHLQGAVEMRRDGTVLRADDALYEPGTDRLRLAGNVHLAEGAARFDGPSLDLRLEAQVGSMPEATYSYSTRGGRGTSHLVEFLGEGNIRLHDATYTTCSADDPAWWIRANELDIHRNEEVAIGHATTLYFEGVPVLTSPWFELPLGDSRRSGLLTPGYGQSTRVGPEFSFPFYWNIAPNYDYTLTPSLYPRLGVMLGNEFRLLEPNFRALADLDVMPNDRTTGNSRELAHVKAEYAPAPQGRFTVNFDRVSDDSYLSDFSRNPIAASPTVLPQEALFTWGEAHWNASLQLAKSQTLVTLLDPGDPGPYERVPDARWNGTWLDWHGLDLGTAIDVTRFQHPAQNPNFTTSGTPSAGWYTQDGNRFVLHPSVSYPVQAPGWFVIPKAQWDYTSYDLDPTFNAGATRVHREVPTLSLDSGLVFERPVHFLGASAQQTLEPRFFYALTPYRNQGALPNFDSAPADFNYAQLFTENSFTGNDRIAQANQLTAAVSSRFIDDATGVQRLRLALGQRFYFGSQLVTLPGQAPRTDPKSDVLFLGEAALAQRWTAAVNLDYATTTGSIALATVGLRWQPHSTSVANLTYRYEEPAVTGVLINQVGASFQWPLTSRLYGVGAVNYSVAEHGWIENLAGIEFKSGCWVGRFVVSRYPVPQPDTLVVSQYQTTFFLQVELNGLTSVGQNPLDQLQRSIPGFHRINPRPTASSPFDFYE